MKPISLALLLASITFAQTKSPNSLKVWFADGAAVDIHTESTGPNVPLSTSGTESVPAGYDYHRAVFGKDTVIFGYDIEARKTAQGNAIRIKPVDTTKFKIGGLGKWAEIPTIAAIREFPPLHAGDAVEVDILYNAATGERIYDVLKMSGDRPPTPAPKPVANRFSLQETRLAIAGQVINENKGAWMRCGGLMIYLPRRGEFYFTLSPPQNLPFQPAAWVDHTVLRFHAATDLVEVTSKTNALQQSDFATVWVYHEPESDRDTAADRALAFHCADDIESLLSKRR